MTLPMPLNPKPNHAVSLLSNAYKSPATTILGLVVAALLTVTHQPDLKHLALAFAVALWGAIQKEV